MENREQKPNLYALATAEPVAQGQAARPKLTRHEQAIQDQRILIEMLRGKGNRPPGSVLKKKGDAAGTAHSTVEKNNSTRLEDTINSQDSVLTNSLKIFAEQSAKPAIPVENST